jgi:hypothetical protein
MTKAKLRETNKLHRFECIGLGQESVEKTSIGIIAFTFGKIETKTSA